MTTMTMSGAAPERSLTQRLDALNRANDVRTRRAKLKKDLKGGSTSIHALLLNPPEYALTAKVFDLLLHVPKYGRVKVNKVLTQCRISPSKTIGGLSERQRTELTQLLRRGDAPAPRPRPRRPLGAAHSQTGAVHLLVPADALTACGRVSADMPSHRQTLTATRVTCATCRHQLARMSEHAA